MKQCRVQLQHKQGVHFGMLFILSTCVKNLKDKFKNSVVTIQEQKKINYEYYEIKYVKTRFTTFTNST
jgi:hypothetical protein